jgi:hypothetical protein
MISLVKNTVQFPIDCVLFSIFFSNKQNRWLPEQFARYPDLKTEIETDSTPLRTYAISTYTEETVKDASSSSRWSWFKGSAQELIRKTICAASFHFAIFNAVSPLYVIVAKTSELVSKIGSDIPGLTSAASLVSRYHIIDATPLVMFSVNTVLRLLNEHTNFQYPALQKAAHITEVISNKLEVIWWVKVVAVCVFNSLSGAAAIGLGVFLVLYGPATTADLSWIVEPAISSLGYLAATFLAVRGFHTARYNDATPDLQKIKVLLNQVNEMKFSFTDSEESILKRCKELLKEINTAYQAGNISRSDFKQFEFQICDKATEAGLGNAAFSSDSAFTNLANSKLMKFMQKHSLFHQTMLSLRLGIILLNSNCMREVLLTDPMIKELVDILISPDASGINIQLFLHAKYDHGFRGFAETKLNGRSWECISQDEQAIICTQSYQEKDKRPSYLKNAKRVTSEQWRTYSSQIDSDSLKRELTHRYYLARLEAFFKGYSWGVIVAAKTVNEAEWGHIHDYRQLAEIASKKNIKLDI